jgi:hypothetical protein
MACSIFLIRATANGPLAHEPAEPSGGLFGIDQAGILVKRHWIDITAVAGALMERKTLTEKQEREK